MWLIDELSEQHILAAQQAGVFDNLPGTGKPLILDDDSAVAEELRAGYRLLKNAGYLPPELEQRKEALQLRDLLANVSPQSSEYATMSRRLRILELNLRQRGLSTDFLYGEYSCSLQKQLSDKE